jgi:hypothetical protein
MRHLLQNGYVSDMKIYKKLERAGHEYIVVEVSIPGKETRTLRFECQDTDSGTYDPPLASNDAANNETASNVGSGVVVPSTWDLTRWMTVFVGPRPLSVFGPTHGSSRKT